MGKKEKLIAKLKSKPKDFTFNEMKSLLGLLGLKMSNKGRTSGSKVSFRKGNVVIYLHKPHPGNELLLCQVKDILEILERGDLI